MFSPFTLPPLGPSVADSGAADTLQVSHCPVLEPDLRWSVQPPTLATGASFAPHLMQS